MTTSSSVAIITHELTRRFAQTVAVDHLTLTVYAGEVFGLLGHNGAGKTTTVRLLNGVLAPSAGSARVLGLDPVSDGPALRQQTGVLTETPSLDARLTARENLAIYAELYNVPNAAARVAELLEMFHLSDRADEKAGGYSKGMQQRLALVRTLLHNPRILFLDEPTAGLDPVAARQVHELILRLSRQEDRTVLLCTHNLVEAQQLCDRVAVLQHGRLLAMGASAELARQAGRSQHLFIEVAPADEPMAHALLKPEGSLVIPSPGLLEIQGIDREMIPRLVTALASAGVRIYRVAAQEPTLQDVYFALTGASVGNEATSGGQR